MSGFFDFFLTTGDTAEPPPDTEWQPTTHRPARMPPPTAEPRPTAKVIEVKRPKPTPVRYGDPPTRALCAAA
ncbi:MAG: hypothetical protein EON60_04210 [Alphaproteobacteria bacterium]|nr:MAG: hypothetical protein EON60_04210 [Alphaproteobacteria bacterium]